MTMKKTSNEFNAMCVTKEEITHQQTARMLMPMSSIMVNIEFEEANKKQDMINSTIKYGVCKMTTKPSLPSKPSSKVTTTTATETIDTDYFTISNRH